MGQEGTIANYQRFRTMLLFEEAMDKIDAKIRERLTEAYSNTGFGDANLCYYGPKKYLFPDNTVLLESIKSFELREDDVWVGGFSRSGTHWLAEQTWLICNNLDYEKALSVPHEERVFYFDFNPRVFDLTAGNITAAQYKGHTTAFGDLPSPRFFKTHLPLSLLPADLLDKNKMVYVVRDPRDVVVSCYHFYKNHKYASFKKDLKEFWYLFRTGHCVYCPYFENIKEYWAQKNHPNLLFLFYEEMYADLHGTMRKVANFLGKNYTQEQFDSLYEHLQFSNMKKNKAVNFDEMLGDQANEVVRKGVAGGWRVEFDEQMTKEAEDWLAENLKDVDLKFS
ncbi:hypothetical protein EVAR_67106_1 [Eumeta japonica]|uniref:Sulfotransferase domain-containing protein n=1 Tax=Eumeta variegata TaxID=151549 RepID=A0A4C1ZIP9_EUMVA|nr:hypothetical protein EVAR_67106_1 [Eumeta japonica]